MIVFTEKPAHSRGFLLVMKSCYSPAESPLSQPLDHRQVAVENRIVTQGRVLNIHRGTDLRHAILVDFRQDLSEEQITESFDNAAAEEYQIRGNCIDQVSGRHRKPVAGPVNRFRRHLIPAFQSLDQPLGPEHAILHLFRHYAFPPAADCLFSDEEIALSQVFPDHRETPLLTGRLQQREDALLCGDRCFPLSEIENMALVQAHLLLLSIHGEYYQLRARGAVNLRKYLEIWKEGR